MPRFTILHEGQRDLPAHEELTRMMPPAASRVAAAGFLERLGHVRHAQERDGPERVCESNRPDHRDASVACANAV